MGPNGLTGHSWVVVKTQLKYNKNSAPEIKLWEQMVLCRKNHSGWQNDSHASLCLVGNSMALFCFGLTAYLQPWITIAVKP